MKTKCKVCGKKFMPGKDQPVYLVGERLSVVEVMTKMPKAYEAVDCPRCGCQNLLNIRMSEIPDAEEGGEGNG